MYTTSQLRRMSLQQAPVPLASLHCHLTKHPEFFLVGGDIYLQAEQTLFRVHSHFLIRDSSRFRYLFRPPSRPAKQRRGTTPRRPIRLDEKAETLELLFQVIYNPRYNMYSFTTRQWGLVLDIAHRWELKAIREVAISEVDKILSPTSRRIGFYSRHKVPSSRLIPYYLELCLRPDCLSDDEIVIIGQGVSSTIMRTRERSRFDKDQAEKCLSEILGCEVEHAKRIGAYPIDYIVKTVPLPSSTSTRLSLVDPHFGGVRAGVGDSVEDWEVLIRLTGHGLGGSLKDGSDNLGFFFLRNNGTKDVALWRNNKGKPHLGPPVQQVCKK
ncbi:hypothetical protein BDN72DRAFT_853980 [Pluteus cervinus]|uniref:Uncharacterized protein n=1 Tax=Pluteus cervinus TaxID=181527 RepID=A0ACD3BAD8_9AGAR|nr:hypothetical protein BDN72DRAFT_853980 [Pluteus cervinus]